jgi:hypothetical protein
MTPPKRDPTAGPSTDSRVRFLPSPRDVGMDATV